MEKHPFDNGELNVRDEKLARLPRERAEIRKHIADYYAMITHMDAQIGKIIKILKEIGEIDNTIIIYTADHGLSIGQHGLMGKQNMYDHSIKIPLIMSGYNLPNNKNIEALNSQIDIFPTIFDLINLPIPETVEGISLQPLISGKKTITRKTIYTIYQDKQRMIKDERWKLIRYYYSKNHDAGKNKIQLFDLKKDPWETKDLSSHPQYQDIILYLILEMHSWQFSINDPLSNIPILPVKPTQ